MKQKLIDRELKVSLLKAIQRGYFLDEELQQLREKVGFDIHAIEIIDKTGIFSDAFNTEKNGI